jgi:unsaturated pyranuronate lyase
MSPSRKPIAVGENIVFSKQTDVGYETPVPGIDRKTLVYGNATLMTEFRLHAGHTLPRHNHPHEQTGYLIKGRLRMSIGDEVVDVAPGDSWCIAPNVEHGAEIVEDSIAVEVFSPVREDYLPE